MPFKHDPPGCSTSTSCGCTSGTVHQCFHFTGCGVNAAGISVDLFDGTTHHTATSDATGTACLDVPAGSYTLSYSGAGWQPFSGPFTVGAGGTTSYTLTPAAGYSCAPNCCDNAGPPPWPDTSQAPTIYYNDGLGAVPLSNSGGEWVGPMTRTAARAYHCSDPHGEVDNVSVTIQVRVRCNPVPNGDGSFGAFQVFYEWSPCRNSSDLGGACVNNGLLPTDPDPTCGLISLQIGPLAGFPHWPDCGAPVSVSGAANVEPLDCSLVNDVDKWNYAVAWIYGTPCAGHPVTFPVNIDS